MARVSASYSWLIGACVVATTSFVACGLELSLSNAEDPLDASAGPSDASRPRDATSAPSRDAADDARPDPTCELPDLTCGKGACARVVSACPDSDGNVPTCEPGLPSAEICDGIDNDCNDQVDDELGTISCGEGACRRTVAACSDAGALECTPGDAVPEIACDDIDNDCNGTPDDLGPFVPLAVSGFDKDVIAESSPASTSTSHALDGASYVLYSAAYGVARGSNRGLPNDQQVGPAGRRYALRPYNANNAIVLMPGESRTLTVTTPVNASAVSVLGFGTEGAATVTLTFEYTDGSSDNFPGIALRDWFNGGEAVSSGFDRTSRDTNDPGFSNNNPSFYALDVRTCGAYAKLLRAVRVSNTSAVPTTRAAIFAVSVAP